MRAPRQLRDAAIVAGESPRLSPWQEAAIESIRRGRPVAYRLHLIGGTLDLSGVEDATVVENWLEGTKVRRKRRRRWPAVVAIVLPFVGIGALLGASR